MYSGTTFHTKSGRVIGAHQRIDRIARRSLKPYLKAGQQLPPIRDILHFEGKNGPDGIKRKSPAKDEPWHYIDPKNTTSDPLLGLIDDHIQNLAAALTDDNHERASFEAAWLAHAIVDGLTPAHHYPLEEKLEELRGEGLETRTTTKKKLVLPGKTRRHQFKNNWAFWGARGVMTTHFNFELGVATTLASQPFEPVELAKPDLDVLETSGYEVVFLDKLRRIDELDMYHEFARTGWTRRLARETREILLPEIVEAVMLAWWAALKKAEKTA